MTGADAAQRWAQVEALVDLLLDLPAADREAALHAACNDPALRDEVRALLRASDASDGFLEHAVALPDARLRPGERLGGWVIEALIGRGGMGEVYRVHRDGQDFQQLAALKLLTCMDSPDARQRFAVERRVLARLRHPGIAHLIDGGEYAGLPYAVMELVEGEPLDHVAARLDLRARIRLFLDVCAAVGHAHRHLLLHRDLKPANILVDREGRVKLLDFGIAKPLDAAGATTTQLIRLSPDYAAPEQLRAEALSAATDVYALGVILHELLSGQRLWQLGGMPLVQVIDRLQQDEPPPPSQSAADARALRGDLDAIAARALRNDPSARYPTVDALADDLRAWLDGRVVQARADDRGYRVRRFLRRHWKSLSVAALLAVSVLAGTAGVAWQAHQAQIERDIARREAERADAVRQYLMLMFRSAGEHSEGQEVSAKSVLDRAAARIGEEFAGDPVARADILLALADLYFYLNDYAGARPLLNALLQQSDQLDPATLAMARHDLAQVEFRQDQPEEARELLTAAQSFWQSAAASYRGELLESRLLQSQLERAGGDAEAALRTLEQALPERIALSGEQQRDSGVLVNNLGIAYFQAGRYAEAIAQFERADAIWAALGLQQGADALNTANNRASAEFRLGKLEEAAAHFQRAADLRQQLYGPSAALAAVLSNLGKTRLQLGEVEDAIGRLEQAVAMAEQYAGANSVLALSARLGWSDALLAGTDPAAAKSALAPAATTIASEFPEAHPLRGLAMLGAATIAKAAGERDDAKRLLGEAVRLFDAAGPALAPHRARLDALREALADAPAGAP